MTRRSALWLASRAASTAGAAPFFADWLRAAQPQPHHSAAAPPEPDRFARYTPAFFSPADYRMLDAFTAILIPTDSEPGAREAHAAAYIDFVLAAAAPYAPEMQVQWRKAFAWLNRQRFAELAPPEQEALVDRMAGRDRKPMSPGFDHYRLIREMTVHAFYTSRAGLIEALEYKGNAYLKEFPACNHPEHKRV